MNFLYDRTKCPSSWDFLQWLINIKVLQSKTVDRSKIKVAFRGEYRNDGLARPIDQRKAIFDHVMRPAIPLIGAEWHWVPDDANERFYEDIAYTPRAIVEHAKHGGEVPHFLQPSVGAMMVVDEFLKGRKPLVLTLRECSYYPTRNSNLEAWLEFVRTCGEDVIFVRDTAKADEPLPGFETFPLASKALYVRQALMNAAKCNLLVANGPWVLALYSPTPWLCFGQLHPEIPQWGAGAPKFWEKAVGVPVGTQFPWSTDKQRLVWKSDTLENIRNAWEVLNEPSVHRVRSASSDRVHGSADIADNAIV